MKNMFIEDGIHPFENYNKLKNDLKESNRAICENQAFHLGAKKLIELGGVCSDTALVIEEIKSIEQHLNEGMSYNDVFTQFAYYDCFTGNLALLISAEERFNADITSAEQWQSLTQINPEHMEWIKSSFTIALEARYYMALAKVLDDGGKYSDLLALNPEHFGLPEKWKGIFNMPMSKKEMINQLICPYIDDFFLSSDLEHVTLCDVAEQLKAPLAVIIEAAQYYS